MANDSRSRTELRGLRDWLAAVREEGELLEIDAPVDPIEEMAAIAYMLRTQGNSPALLFKDPRGFENSPIDLELLWSMLSDSTARFAISVNESPKLTRLELIKTLAAKLSSRLPPREIPSEDAPVFSTSIDAKDLDLRQLPFPKHWPLDGGRYAGTADAVITQDPESGHLNIGTYRMMVQGAQELGLYMSPGKDGGLHLETAWKRKEALPVVAAFGIEPLYLLVGSQSFAKDVSEYEFAGGLRGEPIPVVRGKKTGLLLPAEAEFVIEGEIRPGSTKQEGPFGEFTGYYAHPRGEAPLVHVSAIHHRPSPILSNTLTNDGFTATMRSARVWADLAKLGIPGIKSVAAHRAAAGGYGMTVVSLEQRYAGHASQVLSLAGQVPGGAYYTKWVVVVDDDVDAMNLEDVVWAMSTRCSPIDDIDIIRDTWSTSLDPSKGETEDRRYGSKALINACKPHRHLGSFSERTSLRDSMHHHVAGRWAELGLPGAPPTGMDLYSDPDG